MEDEDAFRDLGDSDNSVWYLFRISTEIFFEGSVGHANANAYGTLRLRDIWFWNSIFQIWNKRNFKIVKTELFAGKLKILVLKNYCKQVCFVGNILPNVHHHLIQKYWPDNWFRCIC